MWYRSWIPFAFAALIAAGCSSSPDVEDDVPREGAAAEVRADEPRAQYVSKAYEDAARWLPAETVAVYVQSTEPFWDMIGDLVLPMANPDAEPGSAGTVEGLRRDMSEFSRQYFGFDTWQVDTVVMAVHDSGGLGVAFGDFDTSLDLPTTEIDGKTVYIVDLAHFLEDDLFASELQQFEDQGVDSEFFSSIYLLPIDKPRSGFVGALDPAELESILAADETDTLAASKAGERYAQFFDRTKGAQLAVVGSLHKADRALSALEGHQENLLDDDFVDWVAFSFGDALKLTVTGDRHTLEDLELRADDLLFQLRDLTDEYAPMLAGSVYGDMALAYVQHTVESIAAQIVPRWLSEETLRFDVALSGGSTSRIWGAYSVAIVLAIPLVARAFDSGFDSIFDDFDDLDDFDAYDDFDDTYEYEVLRTAPDDWGELTTEGLGDPVVPEEAGDGEAGTIEGLGAISDDIESDDDDTEQDEESP